MWSQNYLRPLYTAMVLLATALLLLFLRSETSRDTIPEIDPQDEVAAGKRALSSAFFRVCWVANFGGAFSVSMVFYLLPKIVVHLEISSVQHGAMLAASRLVVIATLLTMYATGFWRDPGEFFLRIRRWGRDRHCPAAGEPVSSKGLTAQSPK